MMDTKARAGSLNQIKNEILLTSWVVNCWNKVLLGVVICPSPKCSGLCGFLGEDALEPSTGYLAMCSAVG